MLPGCFEHRHIINSTFANLQRRGTKSITMTHFHDRHTGPVRGLRINSYLLKVQLVRYSMVAIAKTNSVDTSQNQAFVGRGNVAGIYVGTGATNGLGVLYAVANVVSTAGNTTNPRCIVGVVVSGTSDILVVNGVDKTGNAGDAGTGSIATGIGSFSGTGSSSPLTGAIAFAAVYAGDFRSDPQYAAFEQWASALYGITFT